MHTEALLDFEYKDSTITSVRDEGNGYSITQHKGWSIWCDKASGITPKPGDALRLWGRGIGFPIRGIAINGRIVRYETRRQMEDRFAAESAQRDADKMAKAVDTREADDARIAALPDVFRRRIQRFRDGHPDFWWQHQPYELFVCEQAILIAEAMKGPEDVPAFTKLEWNQQKLIVPGLSDQHSGNTFGAACRLAHWYLTEPGNVVKEHGALAVIVGCEAYGCTH